MKEFLEKVLDPYGEGLLLYKYGIDEDKILIFGKTLMNTDIS